MKHYCTAPQSQVLNLKISNNWVGWSVKIFGNSFTRINFFVPFPFPKTETYRPLFIRNASNLLARDWNKCPEPPATQRHSCWDNYKYNTRLFLHLQYFELSICLLTRTPSLANDSLSNHRILSIFTFHDCCWIW